MKPVNSIEVKDVRKHFKIYMDKGKTIKERTLFSNRRRFEVREVLKGISFDVKKGEAIGLIGHNGCGKSTTLKLLTRIMYPDSGTIDIKGRVSSLIELGAGFHPDMSGRENIYINASIFGLSKKEIDERLDDIIAFSELEDYIDTPVRTYSSGMYMRLAFSVAINVNADILLIDEILAVGDANFQAKCFNKLLEIKGKGTTIVIVSHSLGQIEQICERSIWIHEGTIRLEGAPREVHPIYLNYMGQLRQEIAEKEEARQLAKGMNAGRSDFYTDMTPKSGIRMSMEPVVDEEAVRLAEEEAARKEAERIAAEEVARIEAERLAAEEAARQAAEEEAKRVAEEAARQAEEANRLAAEAEQKEINEQEAIKAAREGKIAKVDISYGNQGPANGRWGNGHARLKRVKLFDENGKPRTVFPCQSTIRVRAEYEVLETVEDAVIGFGIFRADGINCYGTNTRIDRFAKFALERSGIIEVELKNVMLMPGAYTLDFTLECEQGVPVDYWRGAERFEVFATNDDIGIVKIDHEWRL